MGNAILEKIKKADNLEELLTTENDSELLFQLSHMRKNIIEWIPVKANSAVLEIGAGCGIVTGLLADRNASVVAVDNNGDYLEVNQYLNRDKNNVKYLSALSECEEKAFDTVILLGLSEQCRRFEMTSHELLDLAIPCLKQGGRLILAMDNKYALKFWAGMKNSNASESFDTISGLSQELTFAQVKKKLVDSGLASVKCYYPNADYHLPVEIFSEKYPIKEGSIIANTRDYENTRYQIFDEPLVADELCKDGLFAQFANSYLLIAKAEVDKTLDQILYVKYNSIRDGKFQLRTSIIEENGARFVQKAPMVSAAKKHLNQMLENRFLLEKVYQKVRLVECEKNGDALCFSFIKGQAILALSDEKKVSMEALVQQIHDAFSIMYDVKQAVCVPFKMTDLFQQMFPECTPKEGMPAYAISNLDSIVSNFVKTESGDVYCLDYEWVANFPVPVNYVKYRSLIYIYKEMQSILSSLSSRDELLHCFAMKDEEIALYDKMESAFQQYVHGKNLKYNYLKRYEKPTVTLQDLIAGGATERIESYEKQLKDKDTHISNMEQISLQKDEMIASQAKKIQLLETDVQKVQRNLQEKADLLGKLEYERKHPLKVLYGKIAGKFFKFQPLDASRFQKKDQMMEAESGYSEQILIPDAIDDDFDSHLNVDQLNADAKFVFSGWTWDAFYKNNSEAQRLVLLERVENDAVVETRAYRTFTIHRPDVAEEFPERNDLNNVGFLCRVKKDELVSGVYYVSILTREKGAKRYKKHRVAWPINL